MALHTSLQAYEVGRYVRTVFDFDARRHRELHTGWQKRIPAGFAVQRLNARTVLYPRRVTGR